MSNKKKIVSVLIALVVSSTLIMPVFADTVLDPVDVPAPEEESSRFLDHPIVKLLADFFIGLFTPPPAEEPVIEPEPIGENEGTPSIPEVLPVQPQQDTVEPLPLTDMPADEAIASLHEDENLGFGEITKLMSIYAGIQEACQLDQENCQEVTFEELLAEYRAGGGMGALFKKYDKPDQLGVGHVRNDTGPKDKSNNGKALGKNK
jgi:hypothetical protein